LEALFGVAPPWFSDPTWAKIAILTVNLWLGFPYFMLICSGALQAIPQDIYHAAEVDGANVFQRFRRITLPLLLVAVGPLLVASFVYNFNNFNIIYLFIQGGPPIAGAATRAGHTDILISYVYNLAFAGGRGADYGLASTVTIIIFFIVAAITLLQFRFTNMWEQAGENV
jgi:ABC-type sugar transport system permease subunit